LEPMQLYGFLGGRDKFIVTDFIAGGKMSK
jgi:hypothetical protein